MKSGWKGLRLSGVGLLGLAAFSLVLVLIGAAPVLRAEDPAAPARAVRLSSVDGRVQISQGGQMIADPAVANTPLFEGTQVVTTDDGRAEIQFEEGSIARISPNSSLTLTVLKPDGGIGGTEIRIDGGLGYFELQPGSDPGHIQVRFSDTVVTPSGFTVLRIDMDNPPGELAVFSGNAHVERGTSVSLDMHGGESLAFNTASPSQYNLAETIEADSWDSWNSDRDQVLTSEAASRTSATNSFPNSGNPAWSDLDANGNWYNVPDQGYVWSPYDASSPGWDPYGNGYWMYNPAYGYNWVSGDSWGYMPFSCGLWSFYGGFGWGWSPGAGPCMPWWNGGFYAINVGYAPPGYLPPRFPHRPPPHPVRPGGGKTEPYPLIAVNKRPPSNGFTSQAARDRAAPVTIAGHVVAPLRPLSPRPQYDRIVSGVAIHGAPADSAARVPGAPGSPVAPGSGTVVRPPAPRPTSTYHPAPAPSRAASAPASHPASSGGGGGGHAGGGGGGGGGGHH